MCHLKSGVLSHREANINETQTNFSKVSGTSAALVKQECSFWTKGASNMSVGYYQNIGN